MVGLHRPVAGHQNPHMHHGPPTPPSPARPVPTPDRPPRARLELPGADTGLPDARKSGPFPTMDKKERPFFSRHTACHAPSPCTPPATLPHCRTAPAWSLTGLSQPHRPAPSPTALTLHRLQHRTNQPAKPLAKAYKPVHTFSKAPCNSPCSRGWSTYPSAG